MLQAVEGRGNSVAAGLIDRFDLEGEAAEAVRDAFEVGSAGSTVTATGVVFLIVSVLSFTRRLQRLYEATWELPARGMRGTGAGLLWIAFFAVYMTVQPDLDGLFDRFGRLLLSFAGVFLLGLLTPYLLLGRRLRARRLLPQAGLTAVGMTALAIWSAIYMPPAFESSAAAYGAIGVAFALLTWLWGLGMVLVAAAVYGSPQLAFSDLTSPASGEGTGFRSR